MTIKYDFKYKPTDPDAYRKLMESLEPSIRRSPSLLNKQVNGVGNENMKYGTVKWFDAKKGYGYIVQDEQGADDVFVHYGEIKGEGFRALDVGDRVAFDVEQTDKGLRAVNVTK